MINLIEAGNTSELQGGTMKDVSVNGREILLARSGSSYYAADNRCPHMGGKLSKGKLEGTVVTCPLHGSQFDIRDGQVVRWLKGSGLLSKVGKILKSPRQLTTYKVKVEDDKILIEM
ncbi:Rieske (2Fe-2S) protein [Chloroflexota bacterium]